MTDLTIVPWNGNLFLPPPGVDAVKAYTDVLCAGLAILATLLTLGPICRRGEASRRGAGMTDKPTRAHLRQLDRDNRQWGDALTIIPRAQWPAAPDDMQKPMEVWRSRKFLLQVFDEKGTIRLSVNRCDWDERAGRFRDDISWDDLQRLKAEAGLGAYWAVEIFPADHAVVNVANMRHLWLLTEPPGFAWNKGTVQ